MSRVATKERSEVKPLGGRAARPDPGPGDPQSCAWDAGARVATASSPGSVPGSGGAYPAVVCSPCRAAGGGKTGRRRQED